MSGHSKWSTIKRKKGAADAARGKLFSKISKEIVVAVREAGGDPEMNSRLRLAMDKAKEANMPNENITRAIKRGTGELGGTTLEQLTYEGYGPGGVAFFLEVTTDNKNRTASDVRAMFSKNGGNLGSNGCVAYMFDKKGVIHFDSEMDEDKVMEIALDAGADDIETDEFGIDVTTSPDKLHDVLRAFKEKGLAYETADIVMIPNNTVMVSGKTAEQVLRLMDMFEEHDDVSNVYANFDIDESEMMALS